MPGIIPPGVGIGQLLQGSASHGATTGGGASTKDVRPTQAIRAWHDLTVTLAKGMPRSLIRTGQLHRGAQLALQRHARGR